MSVISFREAPGQIRSHYEAGSPSCKVSKTEVRRVKDGERYYVTHTFGKDVWAYMSHQWRIVKSS